MKRWTVGAVAAALVLPGCGQPMGTPDERLRDMADEIGIQRFTKVTINEAQLWLTHGVGDQRKVSSRLNNDAPKTSADPVRDGVDLSKHMTLDQLAVDQLSARLEAVKGECDQGRFAGEARSTPTGAVLQDAGCRGRVTKSYLNEKELQPIDRWDAATIDRVLAEVALIHGPRSMDLTFSTPTAGHMGADWSVRFMSDDMKAPDGTKCQLETSRAGAVPQDSDSGGMVSYFGDCADRRGEALSQTSFMLKDVTGAKVVAALAAGARKMGIKPEDVGFFMVLGGPAGIKVQMTPATGVRSKMPAIAEPLG